MLTVKRVEKILDIVAKEYPSVKNKPIEITIKKFKPIWGCATAPREYELLLSKNYDLGIDNNNRFVDLFLPYLKEEFGLDLSWFLADYQSAIDAIVLIHEIGHIIQTSEMFLNKDTLRRDWRKYVTESNKIYNDFREQFYLDDYKVKEKAYRQIPYEYKADRVSVEIFNKYNVKLLSILTGKSQKELRAIREEKLNVLQEA